MTILAEIQNKMRRPIARESHGKYEVVDEALDGTKAIPIVFVTKSSGNASFTYGSAIDEDAALRNDMSTPIDRDSAGNYRVVDEDIDGKKAIPFVAVTKGEDGRFVYAEIGGGGGGEGAEVAWDDITGKPAEFTPAAHTQAFTTISGTATAAQIPTLAQSKITGLTADLGAKLTATKAAAQADSVATDIGELVADFNTLLANLRTAGILNV